MAISTINSSGLNQAGNTVLCTTSGNVGIGTSSPDSKLAVYNATGTSQFRFGASSNYYWDISRDNDVTGNLLFSNNNATSRTTRMVIDASGNVGIGTSSPGVRLDVATSSGSSYSRFTNGTVTVYNGVSSSNIGAFGTSSNHDVQFIANDTERARITSAGLFQFNSGYGSVATAYGCRAWVNFNGTGTPAIRASGNVSSITDNGTGDYTLNFTTALPDTNYCPVVGGDFSQGATRDNGMYLPTNFTFATGTLRISVTSYNGVYTDIDTVLLAIFR